MVALAITGLLNQFGMRDPGWTVATDDVQRVTQPENEGKRAKADDPNAVVAQRPATKQEHPEPEHYTADCDKPKEHKDADFCQQVRMADAAWRQVRIGWFGLGLVGATLLATAFAAFAAWRTVWAMQDTARRQLRAYIAGVPRQILDLTPTGQPYFSFTVTNHGATPAYRLSHAGALRMAPHPLPPDYPFPALPAPDQRESSVVLHPESALPYIAGYRQFEPFSAQDIMEALSGRGARRLYAFVQIDYVDAFNRPHWTRFCVSFKGRPALLEFARTGEWARLVLRLSDLGKDGGLFESAKQHNETDQG